MQRWNNAIHRSRPAEAAAGRSSVSTTAASTVDPYILDFGTSVNVNEDLRRSIREEIQELDDSIVVSKTSKKHEEMVKSQLNQDLAHSHAEMRDLSRSTSDQLENAGVHSSFLSGLKKTLRKDLVETTGLRTTGVNNKNVMEDAEVENNVPPSGNDNKSLAVGTNKHRTNKDIIKEKAETLKKLTASIKQHGEDIDSLFLQKKTHVEAINACKKAIESEALEATAEEKRQEAELKAVDVQNKAQRKRSIKSEIQNIRTRTGAHAQGVADKVSSRFELETNLYSSGLINECSLIPPFLLYSDELYLDERTQQNAS